MASGDSYFSVTTRVRKRETAVQDTIEIVRRHYLFQGLSDDELARLDLRVYRRTAKPGEVLVQEGSLGCDLFIIESGSVEVLRDGGAQGYAHQIATLGKGPNFGELAVFRPIVA